MREIEVLYFHPNIVQRHAPFWRNPIAGIEGCCAHAEGGHAAAAPPSIAMNSRRLIDHLIGSHQQLVGHSSAQAGLVVAFGLMHRSPALRCD
jgi:hypothetical protein